MLTGILDHEAVGNLTSVCISSAISLTWQSPFSLNLTTAETDIIYCVSIFNITNGEFEADLLIDDCTVLEQYYNFAIENPDPKYQYKFIVIPRSNVEGATNGIPSMVNASCSFKRMLAG